LVRQSGVARASAHITTKVTEDLFLPDWEARSWYTRWFQESVTSVFLAIEFMFFFYEAWFTISRT
jgi:hypothetical protein